MNTNKMFTGMCAIALLATLGIGTVFATDINSTTDATKPEISERMEIRERILLTDEQKEEMDARKASREASQKKWAALTDGQKKEMDTRRGSWEASQEKWTALTDEQKEEIYALRGNAANIDGQIIERYLEWGVFNEDQAFHMKEAITEGTEIMRESGRMPMPGKKYTGK